MKKAISNILTGFRWPGRKTTNNSKNPQINAQTSDDEDSRNSEPQNPGKLETEQIMSKIKCDLSIYAILFEIARTFYHIIFEIYAKRFL